jgi:hypothetical protein
MTNRGGMADAQTIAVVVGIAVGVMVGSNCAVRVGLGAGKVGGSVPIIGVDVGKLPGIVGVPVTNENCPSEAVVGVGVPYG